MVEVITIDDYKQVIKNTEINNISDESIQTAINITTLTLDSVCGSNISKRWPLDETNRLHLTIEQKEYIRNAFILQTKYVLDNNIDFSIGTDQSTNGSSSWSQTRLKREQILPEVYELLQTAGVYYTNAFISATYSKPKCNPVDDFYCPGEKSTPIDLEIGDNRYIKQYNPNARRKWLFSDERGLITYTSTNPERWVLDCIINGESVVEPLTNIARFEMIKDILDENGTSLVNPDTHTVTLNEWLKVDLSNNPNKFTNGIETYFYQDNQWKLQRKIEGATLGAPIKLAHLGYPSTFSYNDKYRCLQIEPNKDKIFEFKFNNLGMWNTISAIANTSINITGNDNSSDLITKVFDISENNNKINFNIAPNQIFERNKTLLDNYIKDNFTYTPVENYQLSTNLVTTHFDGPNSYFYFTMPEYGYISFQILHRYNRSTDPNQQTAWYQVFSNGVELPIFSQIVRSAARANDGMNFANSLIYGPYEKGKQITVKFDANTIRFYPANDGASSGYTPYVWIQKMALIKKG